MQKIQGFCEQGNTTLTISGVAGTIARKVQGSFPSATITVYDGGTLNLASTYGDDLSPPTAKANPFVSASDGTFFFYVANGIYDIKFSGGGIAAPFTLGGFSAGTGGSGVPSFAFASLPAPKSQDAGNLARVTDSQGGLYLNSGVQWVGITNVNIQNAPFNCRPDDSTDATTGLNLAFARAGYKVNIPNGTYRFNSNLSVPVCAIIAGEGPTSILKPGAAVTKALSLTSSSRYLILESFKLDGVLTTSAKGIVAGDGSIWNGRFNHMDLWNFKTAGGVGLQISDCVDVTAYDARIEGSYINVLCTTISGATPTTVRFIGGYIREAQTIGLSVLSAYELTCLGTIFESNTQEGVKLDVSAAQNVLAFNLFGCFFENNWAADITKFQFYAYSPVGGGTTWLKISDTYFSQSALTAKAIKIEGPGANAFKLDNPRMVSKAGAIRILDSARGYIELGPDLTYSTVVDSTGAAVCYNVIDKFQSFEAAWTAWTPTYSSDVGNAATTFSGAVTTQAARYKQVGKTVFLELKFTATLNAVTPVALRATVPSGTASQNDFNVQAVQVINNGNGETGLVSVFTNGTLSFSRPGGPAYTASGAVGGAVCIVYESA